MIFYFFFKYSTLLIKAKNHYLTWIRTLDPDEFLPVTVILFRTELHTGFAEYDVLSMSP